MWYKIIAFTLLYIPANTQHIAKNDSDVIVTYVGHAEANIEPKIEPKILPIETTEPVKILIPESLAKTTVSYEDETDGVIFVPNEKPVFRNEDYGDGRVSVGDVVVKNRIVDLYGDKKIQIATESPNQEVLFITGKNSEHAEKTIKKETAYEDRKSVKGKKVKLDCAETECSNVLKSVCGGKIEHKVWRYRLFLNECYFKKVNCAFKYEENRFLEMPIEFCKLIGSHNSARPIAYKPSPPILTRETPAPLLMRRSSSRRSLNLEVDGSFCSHPCPPSCPEHYAPECAVTTKGQRKVFVNHCKLDYNSCTYGTVWHKRPLSECIGTRKADLQQNRAFISWMQQIGIVDSKGRLVQA